MKQRISDDGDTAWLELLDGEDLAFIKRFLLASGSLKQAAGEYGVSYPTIRLRLDRLIAKIEIADRHGDATALEKLLRAKYVEGAMDFETLKQLLEVYRKEREETS